MTEGKGLCIAPSTVAVFRSGTRKSYSYGLVVQSALASDAKKHREMKTPPARVRIEEGVATDVALKEFPWDEVLTGWASWQLLFKGTHCGIQLETGKHERQRSTRNICEVLYQAWCVREGTYVGEEGVLQRAVSCRFVNTGVCESRGV